VRDPRWRICKGTRRHARSVGRIPLRLRDHSDGRRRRRKGLWLCSRRLRLPGRHLGFLRRGRRLLLCCGRSLDRRLRGRVWNRGLGRSGLGRFGSSRLGWSLLGPRDICHCRLRRLRLSVLWGFGMEASRRRFGRLDRLCGLSGGSVSGSEKKNCLTFLTPIQDFCESGIMTETVWPAFSRALTKGRM
jgi:hypothetical protein